MSFCAESAAEALIEGFGPELLIKIYFELEFCEVSGLLIGVCSGEETSSTVGVCTKVLGPQPSSEVMISPAAGVCQSSVKLQQTMLSYTRDYYS